MAKGTKSPEFEKDKITALKSIGKSQREISKVLGHSKTVICNYLKSQNKYGTKKPTGRLEKLAPQFKRRIVREVKEKTSSISKILKSLVDAPCSTRTIKRYINKEEIKHKKRILRPRLTMKHKEKWLEYARQYQTISVNEWQIVVFSDEKKFNLDGPNGFQKHWHANFFQKIITQQGLEKENLLWSRGGGFSSSGKVKLQFVSGRQKKQQIMWRC